MLNITRCFQDMRLFKAVTGTTCAEFAILLPEFNAALTSAANRAKPRRIRREGGGRRHTLPSAREKLFFILFYVKCYTTFDVSALLFDVDRSQVYRWYKAYLPLLEAALGRKALLPQRKIHSVDEFVRVFPGIKEVFVDGTERAIRRPCCPDAQKSYYSGKKKGHRAKNIVMSDADKRILLLSGTLSGSTHDKRGSDEESVFDPIPPDVMVHVDSGFQGVLRQQPHLNIRIPEKKPRGGELSEEAKERNRRKASRRVLVEHALGGVKRFRAVSDVFRSNIEKYADRMMLVACGLWNLHIEMTV